MNSTVPFRLPADVFDWLMRIIAACAGNPERSAPAIHIAGSKGKGSITAMLAAALEEAGYRVGRYMSPHIEDYRERITLGDRYFSDDIYIHAGERLREIESVLANPASREYQALLAVSDGGAAEPTFFELLTLYFFLCAKEACCNVFVVETGMGGRLDPTNISMSECTIITGIELEHTDMLGNTIARIAREKAGIIKPNKRVLIARQKHKDGADALAVFRETAASKNAPLIYLPDFACIENVNISQKGTSWTLRVKDGSIAPFELSTPVPGAVQAENGSIAALAALLTFPSVNFEQVARGFAKVKPPARFEKLCGEPAVVVDGAHTALSIELCAQTWTELYGAEGLLIFGCAMGKDVDAMARSLIPHFKHIIITRPGTYKISEPEKIYDVFKKIIQECSGAVPRLDFIIETEKAICYALETAEQEGRAVLGTGSFYMAAEIRNYLSASISG